MSTLEFKVEDWVPSEDKDPRRAGTAAQISIYIDDVPLTRVLDSWARTVRDNARLPLYPLAEWIASNWWRLNSEVPPDENIRPPIAWRMSHDLASIGGGFIWPRIRFAFDNAQILVSARAIANSPWEPIRHLNSVLPPRPVDLGTFSRAAENLINTVLIRLRELDVSAEPLATIWSDVLAERADQEVTEWRAWEARLGYDPDQAPELLMEQLSGLFATVGKAALSEVAPLLGNPDVTPDPLSPLHLERVVAESVGQPASLPMRAQLQLPSTEPWAAGWAQAQRIRRELGNLEGPLPTRSLTDLLGIAGDDLNPGNTDIPIGLGVVARRSREAVLHFRKQRDTGLRFEAARFLAESISAPKSDHWLPLTDRSTIRQKFQRAFAVELLAPIEEISNQIGENTSSDKFEDIAEQYGVSPLAIRSHLVNSGFLPQEFIAT